MSALDDLAGALARAQDQRLADGLAPRQHAMRAALLVDPIVTDPPAPRRRAWIAPAFALAAVVLLLVVGGLWLRPQSTALTFTIGEDTVAHEAALWIAAPDAPIDVAFSDGSRLVLATGSRARVETSQREGGRVVLESGGVAIDASTAFAVDAGPFALALVDSACDVTWDGSTQQLGIVVHDGRVHVSGPGDQAHEVVAGQRVDISPREQIATASTSPIRSDAPPDVPVVVDEPAPPQPERPSTPKRAAKATTPDWLVLARASKHRDALAAAEAHGFDGLCDSLGPSTLLQLGDTARFAG
jgi:ferric-dicitrate binding protein FerR (iron transport regulator)